MMLVITWILEFTISFDLVGYCYCLGLSFLLRAVQINIVVDEPNSLSILFLLTIVLTCIWWIIDRPLILSLLMVNYKFLSEYNRLDYTTKQNVLKLLQFNNPVLTANKIRHNY